MVSICRPTPEQQHASLGIIAVWLSGRRGVCGPMPAVIGKSGPPGVLRLDPWHCEHNGAQVVCATTISLDGDEGWPYEFLDQECLRALGSLGLFASPSDNSIWIEHAADSFLCVVASILEASS